MSLLGCEWRQVVLRGLRPPHRRHHRPQEDLPREVGEVGAAEAEEAAGVHRVPRKVPAEPLLVEPLLAEPLLAGAAVCRY